MKLRWPLRPMSTGNKTCSQRNLKCMCLQPMQSVMHLRLMQKRQKRQIQDGLCLDLLPQLSLIHSQEIFSLAYSDEWTCFYRNDYCFHSASGTLYQSTFRHLLRRNKMKFGFTPEAEILNGRLAMLGFVIAVGTYLTTGQLLPGVFWLLILFQYSVEYLYQQWRWLYWNSQIKNNNINPSL
jgi:hypothetical protein